MDLEEARKSLSKPAPRSPKRMAFLGVAALCVAGGLAWRAGLFAAPEAGPNAPVAVEAPSSAAPAMESTEAVPKSAPAPQPPAPAPETAAAPEPPSAEQAGQHAPAAAPGEDPGAEDAGEAVDQAAAPSETPDRGPILVSRQPVAMLASPSPEATAMYGFPAGRPFRVIGREGNYAKILDLKSGASGWIDAAALAPPPRSPSVAAPKPQSSGRSAGSAPASPKAKAAKKSGQVAAEAEAPEPAQPQARDRPGVLFGRGGFFGGLFGGGD